MPVFMGKPPSSHAAIGMVSRNNAYTKLRTQVYRLQGWFAVKNKPRSYHVSLTGFSGLFWKLAKNTICRIFALFVFYSSLKLIIILRPSSMLKSPDLIYQKQILNETSRSFAFTIPQLPAHLQISISNAYLLCRMVDTIEDDTLMTADEKTVFSQQFLEVLAQKYPIEQFSQALVARLAPETPAAEVDLLKHTNKVLKITHSLNSTQQQFLFDCVETMSQGMSEFQLLQTDKKQVGLKDISMLSRYCYHVAGVVGEMLTALFCDYDPNIAAQKAKLKPYSVAFGQALQMTNILKDIWDDRERHICWLPQDIFSKAGFDLNEFYKPSIQAGDINPAFSQGISQLVKFTVAELDKAVAYSLLIPRKEKGIRRFCLWAITMSVLTLRNIAAQKGFYQPHQVKISRYQVHIMILLSYIWIDNDKRIQQLYRYWTAPLRG